MQETSQSPRSPVAERKKNRKRKARMRMTVPSPTLGEAGTADWRGLTRAIRDYNAKHPKSEELNASSLARFAARLGGSAHRQQWGLYVNGHTQIPRVDQLAFTLKVQHGKAAPQPQRIFPSWPKPFALVTQLPPKSRIPLLVYMLSKGSSADNAPLEKLAELYVATTPEQRDEILCRAKEAMPVVPEDLKLSTPRKARKRREPSKTSP